MDVDAGPGFFQSGFWGAFKSRFGWAARMYTFHWGDRAGRLLALTRSIRRDLRILYVPYGPDISVPSEEQGTFLERLTEALRGCVTDEPVCVRYDLPWESPYTQERDSEVGGGAGECRYGEIPAEDARPPHRVRELRMNFGTARWNLRKAPTNVLPPDTVMIDLLRSPEALLRRMKPKTRYNIRVSARRGVRVEQVGRGALDRELAVWYGLLEETARRHRILLGDYDYFRELLHLGTCVGRTPDARSVPVQDRVRRIRPAQARLLGLPSA